MLGRSADGFEVWAVKVLIWYLSVKPFWNIEMSTNVWLWPDTNTRKMSRDQWGPSLSHKVDFLQHVSTLSQYVDRNWKHSASHSPGWQLPFVQSSQSFGGALYHLTLGHARHGLMPVCSVDVGLAALQDFTHCNNQAWPAQAVVRRGQGLSLQREGCITVW